MHFEKIGRKKSCKKNHNFENNFRYHITSITNMHNAHIGHFAKVKIAEIESHNYVHKFLCV